MIMRRTFHAIGQGGFYTEQFFNCPCHPGENKRNINIVYDCGSTTWGTNIIDQRVDQAFIVQEKIDAVFISHFHEDHINGLAQLLFNYEVQRLFIPLLDKCSKQIMLASYLINGGEIDSFVYKFIDNPEEGVRSTGSNNFPQIIAVDSAEVNNNDNGEIPIDGMPDTIKSGTKIKFANDINWVYVPFNFRQDERCKPIRDYIKENAMPESKSDEMGKWWEEHKEKLRYIYRKKIQGDLNTNSMVVYSGPNSQAAIESDRKKVGCLYMGDYNAKGKQKFSTLKKAYKAYFENVHTLQIPHHGSRHNYNPDLIMPGIKEFVISFGIKNTYQHPYKKVLETIVAEPNDIDNLHTVTENLQTQYWEMIFLDTFKIVIPKDKRFEKISKFIKSPGDDDKPVTRLSN